jgi:hypothetical protein
MVNTTGSETALNNFETSAGSKDDMVGGDADVVEGDVAVTMGGIIVTKDRHHAVDGDSGRIGWHEHDGLLLVLV